ncbi:hypothetical protein GCM10010862_18390 [Devosia nitrariae]|uniref:Autotransporter domain-containing protein n=1 Tax=Devosia nitrariae TaxID=2071872 RepID=A0ABQ5W4K7_9HYPH|nr:hypothetical protein GCM10010862_18390 [Devosia nitrariae]
MLFGAPPAVSAPDQTGTVVIHQKTDGDDAVFGFHSANTGLGTTIATTGGEGVGELLDLPSGVYEITADDMSGAGFALTGISCSDGDSVEQESARTAVIHLDAGEIVTCTFTSVNSGARTQGLIGDFLGNRTNMLAGTLAGSERRVGRLEGAMKADINKAINRLMHYMPNFVGSRRVLLSTSLNTFDALAGHRKASSFDVWVDAAFTLFDTGAPKTDSSIATLGVDYLVTPAVLAGVYVQTDSLRRPATVSGAVRASDGWLAGPYLTARLGPSLYLDVVAGAGVSYNQVRSEGGEVSGFDATRWLTSASLTGQWKLGEWTFSPRARVGYSEAISQAYIDALGVPVPTVTGGTGQVALGPGISHKVTTSEDFDIETRVRLEGVVDVSHNAIGWSLRNPKGRIEGGLGIGFPQGANLNLSATYEGIGVPDSSRATGKVRLSLPLN